ncbi:MAG: hypothetical protein A2503_09185 [Burkholderiales bacterium RIFOXYD12_FULL_59_19]|nr:MAG: hypothetical protein A2503_09185 [Burkholderiales bacterium RIFOXYD12_FULL_59_19]
MIWLFASLLGGAQAQQNIPQDLLDLRAKSLASGASVIERQKICESLVPAANSRLPAQDSWRLRVALDCANTDATAGELGRSIQKLDALLKEIRSLDAHPAMEIIAMKYRATALANSGLRVEGVKELEKTLELANQRFGVNSAHSQDVGMRLCGAYQNANRYDDAIILCGQIAKQRASSLQGDFIRANANRYAGSSFVRRNNDTDVARGLELLKSAAAELSAANGEINVHTLQTRREYAYGLLRNKQYDQAHDAVRLVREGFVRLYGERHDEVTNSDALLRVILIERGNYTAALLMKDGASKASADASAIGVPSPMSPTSPISQLSRDLVVAITLLNLQKNDEALPALQAWADGIETLRNETTLDAVTMAQFAQEWHSGYQYLAIANHRKGFVRQALVSLELAKARSLNTSMEEMDRLRSLPKTEQALALDQVRQAALQRQRQRLATPGSPLSLEASRLATQLEDQFAQRLARGAASSSRARISGEVVDADVARLAGQLNEDEAYLSLGYGLSKSETVMPLLLRRNRTYAPSRPLVVMRNLDRTIYAMRMLTQHGTTGLQKMGKKLVAKLPEGFDVVDVSASEPRVDDARVVVEYLSGKLLQPFRNELKGIRRLIVSPDGPTWLIPFDLLELDGQPLFKSVTVSYAPSVSVLNVQYERLVAHRQGGASARLLTVGGAHYQNTVQLMPGSPIYLNRVKGVGTPSPFDLAVLADATSGPEFFGHLMGMVRGVPDLPGSLQEVRLIGRQFQSANVLALTESSATEKQVDALVSADLLGQYDYIHFATHGIAQTRRPLMSALVLGLEDRGGKYDGYISAQEISSWNLQAKVVVLSACDSAMGVTVGGEGILGLPHAFLVAGAATTIQTLWAIPDMETAGWMASLYQRMLGGDKPSNALAWVKQKIASEQKWIPRYELPTPWAAFAVYGW